MKLLHILSFFASSYSMATGSAPPHRALLEECETTSEPFEFEGLWILDVVGTPTALLANKVELQSLEDAIQTVFACNQEELFYSLTNVTARLDLMQESGTTSRTFSLPISIEGQSNLVDLQDAIFFEDRRQLVEDPDLFLRTRNLRAEACACLPLIAEVFLTKLSENILVNKLATIEKFVGILETEERRAIAEVEVVDCAPDLSQFVSFAAARFSGYESLLTKEETVEVEGAFLASFNRRAEQVCDPFLRTLIGVRMVRVAVEKPTSAPSYSSIPSDLPSLLPSLAPSSIPSDLPSLAPSEMPSSVSGGRLLLRKRQDARQLQDASLELTANATGNLTEAPTQAPTARGPDLFSLFFELTGQCNGCEADSNLFDEVAFPRRFTKRASDVSHDVRGARFLEGDEESKKCACDEEAEDRGVRQDEFFDEFSEVIEQKELKSMEEVKKTEELEELPPTLEPTSSPLPSVPPTVSPSLKPSTSSPPSAEPSLSLPTTSKPSISASPSRPATPSMSAAPSAHGSNPPTMGPSLSFAPSAALSRPPSSSASPTAIVSDSGPVTPYVSAAPSPSSSASPTAIVSDSGPATPSVSAVPSPSEPHSEFPSEFPSESSKSPSETPSKSPSKSSSETPSNTPSNPSASLTSTPSSIPPIAPSESPSGILSRSPSPAPSTLPSPSPSDTPSGSPYGKPCDVANAVVCTGSLTCARKTASDDDADNYICCDASVYISSIGVAFCTGLENGSSCLSDTMCDSDNCSSDCTVGITPCQKNCQEEDDRP